MVHYCWRGCSSNGRALAQHARGTGIDTLHLQAFWLGRGMVLTNAPRLVRFGRRLVARWPSGLRRCVKAAISSEAWVRTPPSSQFPGAADAGAGRRLHPQCCDRMAEWSKAPDPSSGLFGGAGSNPAPVTFCATTPPKSKKQTLLPGFEPGLPDSRSGVLTTTLQELLLCGLCQGGV